MWFMKPDLLVCLTLKRISTVLTFSKLQLLNMYEKVAVSIDMVLFDQVVISAH